MTAEPCVDPFQEQMSPAAAPNKQCIIQQITNPYQHISSSAHLKTPLFSRIEQREYTHLERGHLQDVFLCT